MAKRKEDQVLSPWSKRGQPFAQGGHSCLYDCGLLDRIFLEITSKKIGNSIRVKNLMHRKCLGVVLWR